MVANFFDFIAEPHKILECFGALSRVAQKGGGVIEGHNFGTVKIKPLSVLFGYTEIAFYKTGVTL